MDGAIKFWGGIIVLMIIFLSVVYLVKKESFGNVNDKPPQAQFLGLVSPYCVDGQDVLMQSQKCISDSRNILEKKRTSIKTQPKPNNVSNPSGTELYNQMLNLYDAHLGTSGNNKGLNGAISKLNYAISKIEAAHDSNNTKKNEKFGGAIGQPDRLQQMMGPA